MDGGTVHTPWPSSIPELTTARLRLRAPHSRDAADLFAIFSDPEVTRYHSLPTFTSLGEAEAGLERLNQRFAARDTIRWAIELVEQGEMIGTVGLLRFDFEHRRAELGYDIARRWWGHGLAPEAAAAVIRYGFSVLGLHHIEAGVLPGNDASVRVLHKLGFLEEGIRRDYLYAKGRFHSFRWFSLLETDEQPGGGHEARIQSASEERMAPSLNIAPIAGALGAEITGVDLSKELSHETVAAIRRAWLDHLVVFFRDQDLPPASFLAFARRFGQPIEYPFVKGLDDFPEIIPVLKLETERVNFGGIWHSDTAYLDVPPMASMLVAREVPAAGGDTLFANMYLAYETLSDGMKRMLDGLVAVNSSAAADVSRTREDRLKDSARADAKKEYNAAHPVVRVHPETGRRALYVNVAHTVRFEGMTEEESAPILRFLYQHQVRPEFTCRFPWRNGSLAFWDNRCAQHNAINDYQGHRRLLHRITLAGDKPKGP